ncbi:TPA: ATPase [Streptococcus pyogenes]
MTIEEAKKEQEVWAKKIEDANQAATEAQNAVDLVAYDKAKSDLFVATNSKELYEKRLDKLVNEPLVSYDDYFKFKKELQDIEDSNQLSINQEAFQYIKKLQALAEKSRASIETTNSLLHQLQYGLGKNKDQYKRTKTGAVISFNDLEYKYNTPNVFSFYHHTMEGSALVNAMKQGENENEY